MFGDVVSVHTETGAYAGGYEYDAWGNITSGGGSGIGAVNPFRYRGYYYDQETGFYYLQTRYYDPEICRFISADNLELIPSLSQVPGQLNLYAYCNNNPIMFTDPSGEIAITTAILIGLGVGAAVGLGVGLTYGLVTGARGWELAGYIILGASGGALLGGLIGAVIWSGAAAIQMLNSGFLYLAGGGGGTAGGALAIADVSVMVAGGAVVVGGTVVGLLGANIMFSKHDPGMSNKPPVSWISIDEGMSVFSASGNNSEKAAEYLLNNKYGAGNWGKGAKTEFNALKKWFDRIIRIRKG